MVQISVIICCYNSQHLIKETLEHLANQDTNDAFDYEVVLVDNNCTDHTVEVANNVWKALDTTIDLNVVTESKPGLSYARETGVKHSKGELVVFCDDDNWLASNYLQIAFDFMMVHPEVGALGGQSLGELEIDIPDWWDVEKTNYAVGKQANKSGNVTKRGYVWGAGIVVRRAILNRLYAANFKSLLLGRKAEVLSSGDDSEICLWVILMGYKLWYLEDLKFKHFITKVRLNKNYLKKLKLGHKQSHVVLDTYRRFYHLIVSNNGYNLKRNQKKKYLKKGIKGILFNHKFWKEHLQLAFDTKIKIDSNLYEIIKTYKKVNNL